MQPAAPRVSIIIPCYNAAGFVAEALDSILAQSFSAFEVLIVNDGSPDTAELERALLPYRSRIRYLRQENRGPGGARNTGILAAGGEYVAFLDSDDTWEPHFLTEQMRRLDEDPGLDLVYSDALLVGDTPFAGRTFMSVTPSRGEVTFSSLLRRECVPITSCVVARRRALVDAGLFDARFFHSEDFDLWLRLAHRGGRIGYQPLVLAKHRAHARSLTSEVGALLRSQVEICAKLTEQLALSTDEEALLRAHREWCAAHLSLEQGKRDLLAGRYQDASVSLREARRVLGGRKLVLSALAVRIAPGLVRRLYLRQAPAPFRSAAEAPHHV